MNRLIIALCLISGLAFGEGTSGGVHDVNPKDFYLEVAKGNVPGHTYVNKFGHNLAVATGGEDVWAGGGTYAFYPTNAQTVSAVSTSTDDDVGQIGAQAVIFYGLDATGLEINETVSMDGTTAVALTNTWRRMFRGVVLTIGTSESNVGNISVTNAAGTVAIYIAAEDGQTQQAIYTIPSNKTGYFVKGYVAMAADNKTSEVAGFKWKARMNNGTTFAWQTKGQVSCGSLGSSWWQYLYGIPAGPLPGWTDVRLDCFETTVSMGVVGGFDILLVEDGY